jgi:hypothetical protein
VSSSGASSLLADQEQRGRLSEDAAAEQEHRTAVGQAGGQQALVARH